jgi:hypothetical protein
VSLRRRFQPGIHQIWLPELGVVDRCTTCHLGLKEASLADVNEQPFRKHPAIPHALDGFGCVICHGGQGAATTVAEAHHSERAGEEPILPARYIESGCGQCHQNALPGTPQLNLGRTMLTRYGCVHCHAITRPDGSRVEATDHPPSLAHIADKTTREWILQLAEISPGLRDIYDDAQLQTERRGRERHLGLPGEREHAAGGRYGFGRSSSEFERRRTGRSGGGSELVWRIVLRFLPRRSECRGQPGGRRRGAGADAHRQQGKARVACSVACESAYLRYDNAHAALPLHEAADRDSGRLSAGQVGFRLRHWRSSGCGQCAADCARATTDCRAGMRRLPHDQRCAEARELCARTQHASAASRLPQIVFLPGMEHTLSSYIAAKIRQPRAFGSRA